jgi:hypothetical protein
MKFILWIVNFSFSFAIKSIAKLEKKTSKMIDDITKQLEKIKADLVKVQDLGAKLNSAKSVVFPAPQKPVDPPIVVNTPSIPPTNGTNNTSSGV